MTEPMPKLTFGKRAISLPPESSDKLIEAPVPKLPAPSASPKPGRRIKVEASVEPAPVSVENPLLDDDEDEEEVAPASSAPSPAMVVEPPTPTVKVTAEVAVEPSVRAVRQQRSKRPSRFQLTDEHVGVLRWMDKARYTSNEQVAIFAERDLRSTRKLLLKLERYGYVKRKQFAGYPTAYYLSPAAKDLLESETRAVDEATGPGFIRHTLAVGWVMLGFLKGQLQWSKKASELLGRPVGLDDFISEPELARSTNRRFGEVMTALERKAQADERKTLVKKWEGWDALKKEVSDAGAVPEHDESNLHLWAAFGENGRPHYPDLILKLPADQEKGVAQALAIEVERSYKPASAAAILESYEPSMGTRYGTCLWLCADSRVSDLVTRLVNANGDRRHQAGPASVSKHWKDAYLRRLEADAQAVRDGNAAARRKDYWHVTATRRVTECRCGQFCRARYGRQVTKQDALALLEELA